jgi:hypothetical protein
MSLTEIMQEIDALNPEDRWKVLEHTRHSIEDEIPESFRRGMDEIQRGETIDLDEALQELDSSR